MLRVQRAIAGEILFGLVAATVVVTVVLFAARGVHLLNRTPGLEIRYLLPLLPALLPAALAMALPYALAVSTALVYGRIVADREVAAMRLSGLHVQAIVVPAAAVGALLSLVTLWLYAGPAAGAEQQLRSRQRDLADRFLALLSGPDRSISLEAARISFGRYADGEFHDVEIDRRAKDTGVLLQKVIGDRVTLRRVGSDLEIRSPLLWVVGESGVSRAEPVLRLPAGEVTGVGGLPAAGAALPGIRLNVGFVESIGASTGLVALMGGGKFELKPKDMTLDELSYIAERGGIPGTEGSGPGAGRGHVSASRTDVELHGRLAAGAAPLLFALVVAAGALQVRTGGRRLLAFLVALSPVFVVHFPLSLFGRSLAEAGTLPPAVGVWAAPAATLLVAAALLRRASVR